MSDHIVDKIIKGELDVNEQTEYFCTIDIMSEIFNIPTLNNQKVFKSLSDVRF